MSLEYSDMTHQEIRYVNPCFCCEMKTHRFYLLANSTLFILSFGMIVFALLMLFEFNIIFSSLGLLLIASFHLIISLVSFLKFHRYKTIGTRFHKWQAIGNIMMAFIGILVYSGSLLWVMVLSVNSDLKKADVWADVMYKFKFLCISFPLFFFFSYWSLLFMKLVSEKREKYISETQQNFEESEESDTEGEVSSNR